MLGTAELAKVLKDIDPTPYERNVFRSVELDALLGVTPMQPLYDLGPGRSGQRFTPVGGPPALYVSEHPATSYFEGTGLFSSVAALAQQNAPATAILNLHARIECVLDITVPAVQVALGTTAVELAGPWKWKVSMGHVVSTHVLANVVYASGRFQAMRFNSARVTGEANLIIWTQRLVEPAFVEVTDDKFAQRIPLP